MVVDADAVVQPHAVMVIPLDALIARAAVKGAGCLDYQTLRAHLDWVNHAQ
jgi:hypothetical protein